MALGLRALFLTIIFAVVSIYGVWFFEMKIHYGLKVAVLTTFLLYLLIPFVFHFVPWIQRHLVFLPWAKWPHHVMFDAPGTEGIVGGRNIVLQVDKEVWIGVWHILPKTLAERAGGQTKEYWEKSLVNSGRPIILYLHGNSGSRAGEHRKELYLLLQSLDYHVLCLDYRGYADSTQVPPSETGVVADALRLYTYVRNIIGNDSTSPKVFVWGHSLGTGVSTHMVGRLCLRGMDKPAALILESPFTSLGEEVKHHMLSTIYRYIPGFHTIFVAPLIRNDIAFESEKHIAHVDIPIAILHAVDDPVIPYKLGRKLYSTAVKQRLPDAKLIHFRRFDEGFGYAHKFICRAPELLGLIERFVNCTLQNDVWPCPDFTNEVVDP